MSEGRLFVSYSRRDKDRVLDVASALTAQGLDFWLDRDEVKPSHDIVRAMDEGLSGSKYFLIFFSDNYRRGEWTMAEYSAIVHLAVSANERKVITVRIDQAELPPLLAPRAFIPWTDARTVAREIASVIHTVDLSTVGGAVDALARDVHAKPVRVSWDEVQDHLIDTALIALFKNTNSLRFAGGVEARLEVPVSNESSMTLGVSTILLANDALMFDLESEFNISQVLMKLVNRFRRTLVEGGLGIMQPAFELAMEREQIRLQQSRSRLRTQLTVIVPTLLLRVAARQPGAHAVGAD